MSASPPLYSQQPRSEPSDSSAESNQEDDDGFINRRPKLNARSPSRSVSPPPNAKRTKFEDSSRNALDGPSRPLVRNGSAKYTDSPGLSELAISILNVEPVDEFIKEVADFIQRTVMEAKIERGTLVEVEAKIGLLRDKRTRERLTLPTVLETILPQGFNDAAFESNLSVDQHRKFNHMLNQLMTEPPDSSGPSDQPPSKIQYVHRYLTDDFYESPHGKIRVTTDQKTNQLVECIQKIRLGDLNILSPKWNADWRISVNLERPIDNPPDGPVLYSRKKDRLTYTHESSRIDLTQVTTQSSSREPPSRLHELELEIVPSSMLMALIMERGRDDKPYPRLTLDEAVRVFVNNARILVRNA